MATRKCLTCQMIIPAAADKCAHCGAGQPAQFIGAACVVIGGGTGMVVSALLDLGFLWFCGLFFVGAIIGVIISVKIVKAMTGDNPL